MALRHVEMTIVLLALPLTKLDKFRQVFRIILIVQSTQKLEIDKNISLKSFLMRKIVRVEINVFCI